MQKKLFWAVLTVGILFVPGVLYAQTNVNTDTNTNDSTEVTEEPMLIAPLTNDSVDTTAVEEVTVEEIPVDLVLETEIDNELADPGLLPDSPFYFFKNWSETFREWFTFGDEKKAELQYRYALRRAAEIQKLLAKGKDEQAQKHLEKYEEHLEKFTEKVNKMADNKPAEAEDLLNKFEQLQVRQQGVLADVYEDAPEAAKAGLLNAIDNSSKGMENAIEKLDSSDELNNYMDRVETRLETEFQNSSEDVKNKIQNRVEVRNNDDATDDDEVDEEDNSGNSNGNSSNGNQPDSAGNSNGNNNYNNNTSNNYNYNYNNNSNYNYNNNNNSNSASNSD